MNDIFKFRENFYIFQIKKPPSLKYGLDAIPNRTSQWQQILIDIHKAASLALASLNVKIFHEDFPKYLFKMLCVFD